MPISRPDRSIGVGQTWQIRSGQVANTVYTNTTGRPIMVTVWTYMSTVVGAPYVTPAIASLDVGGVSAARIQVIATKPEESISMSAIVPHGATYAFNLYNGPTGSIWYELR